MSARETPLEIQRLIDLADLLRELIKTEDSYRLSLSEMYSISDAGQTLKDHQRMLSRKE